jgi:hypothetical protein
MSEDMTIIPFGKFRGMSLSSVLTTEPTYLLWLLTLKWARQKYPDLYKAVIDLGPELLDAVQNTVTESPPPNELVMAPSEHSSPEWRSSHRRRRCAVCGKYWADSPSDLCPGCEAYEEHQR